MGETRFLPGFAVVALAALGALAALLAAGLSRPGPRRAGLVAGALPLALLPAALAAAYASWKLVGLFAALGGGEAGPARGLLASFEALWLLQRAAWAAFAVCCLLGLAIGLWRSGGSTADVACSARRGLVLLLLPLLGLVVAGMATRPLVRALRVSTAVITWDEKDEAARSQAEAALRAEGLAMRGPGSIAATSTFVSRAMLTGVLGGAAAAVVLLGLALPGFILGARVRFGAPFAAAASLVWLLGATGAGLVAFGLVGALP